MPTPNIPDEVVEAAAKALADAIGHGMTEKCEAHARLVIEAALPLLLEQVGYRWSRNGIPCSALYEGEPSQRELAAQALCKEVADWAVEPLYRLKVSNEQK